MPCCCCDENDAAGITARTSFAGRKDETGLDLKLSQIDFMRKKSGKNGPGLSSRSRFGGLRSELLPADIGVDPPIELDL